MSNLSQALTDVTQAQSLGLTAFALNIQQPDAWWTHTTLQLLFAAAAQTGFKLFFSMDMSTITSPQSFVPLFNEYAASAAYYTYNARPFLSTFRGGGASSYGAWASALSALHPSPFFVPNFDDWAGTNSAFTPEFFQGYPILDGVMAWETAWPAPGETGNVSAAQDEANIAAARGAGNVYMMPVSTFQSKHMDGTNNWFRRGGLTLPLRMAQVLECGPDFVELLTWNDAGEGHYVGNIWPEAIGVDNGRVGALVDGYDHSAWQGLFGPFIAAMGIGSAEMYPAPGDAYVGAFWYRPLLKGVDCEGDRYGLGKPSGWEDAEDVVSVAVVLSAGSEGVSVKVWSGGGLVGQFEAAAGLNMYQVDARQGRQVVELVSSSGVLLGKGVGSVDVSDSIEGTGGVCNFNYQVVGIA
ncbi:glycoside hydrolase [Podospora appendiculata]|uniref:Glycoside hydrolase n=1 Tax=Podospora appendiculata TaxID=314037 RepID=A0AAE0XA87_9PEZI|nr:glycoside hydrolase [Podospora appendiculata]